MQKGLHPLCDLPGGLRVKIGAHGLRSHCAVGYEPCFRSGCSLVGASDIAQVSAESQGTVSKSHRSICFTNDASLATSMFLWVDPGSAMAFLFSSTLLQNGTAEALTVE